MSHWQAGKLDMSCSLAVLKRALLNIMPGWENSIQESADGKLSADNQWQGKLPGFHLVVKLERSDMGFKQNPDGSWEIKYDNYTLPPKLKQSGGPGGKVTQEIFSMRTRAIAQLQGLRIVKDADEGEDRVIQMLVPEDGVRG